MPVEFDRRGAALPRRHRGALLRAFHADGLPLAGDGVRAHRGHDRQGLRDRRHRRRFAALAERAARGGTFRLAGAARTLRPRCAPASSESRSRRTARARYVPLRTARRGARRLFGQPEIAAQPPGLGLDESSRSAADARGPSDPQGRSRPEVRRHRPRPSRHHAAGAGHRHDARQLPARRHAVEPPARGARARTRRVQGAERRGRVRPRRQGRAVSAIALGTALDYAGERADLALQLEPTLLGCSSRTGSRRCIGTSRCR